MSKRTVAQAFVKANSCLEFHQVHHNWLLTHFLMFGQWPRLPIDFVFPTHEVVGTLRPVDSYVADLITALRKAF